MQRFTLDELLFFIAPKKTFAERRNVDGKWIVPYVIEQRPDKDPNVVRAYNAAVATARATGAPEPPEPTVDVGVPEDAAGELPERDRLDPTTDANFNAQLDIMEPRPDQKYAQLYRHFLFADPNTQRVIGEMHLKPLLEAAERLDYDFALRMQGLQNTTINAVWVCSESSGAQPEDRAEMMDQFLRSYLSRFLGKVPQTTQEDPEEIIREAVQMHQQFCAGWVREHKRCLSPTIEAAAEALVGLFWDGALRPAVRAGMSWKEMSRVIRRDARLSPQFGLCLHFYMVKLEQDRGSRNASYKSMFNASSANMLAINAMDKFLRKESGYISSLTAGLTDKKDRRFNVKCMDWYLIVSQLPPPKMEWTGLKKSRLSMPGQTMPWARNYVLNGGQPVPAAR